MWRINSFALDKLFGEEKTLIVILGINIWITYIDDKNIKLNVNGEKVCQNNHYFYYTVIWN